MLDVAAVAHQMFRVRPKLLERMASLSGVSSEALLPWLTFLIALHDVGKLDFSFQSKVPEIAKTNLKPFGFVTQASSVHHDLCGVLLWENYLLKTLISNGVIQISNGLEPFSVGSARDLLQPWIAATCGHHGSPPQRGTQGLQPSFPKVQALAISTELANLFQISSLCIPSHSNTVESRFRSTSWLLAGITNISDWIGSQTEFFPYEKPEHSLGDYWNIAKSRADVALRSAGMLPATAVPYSPIKGLLPKNAAPTPLQQVVEDMPLPTGPNLVVIEDSTGSGKTEAAVHLVHRLLLSDRAEGLYFALPTMSTANAMYGRIGQLIEKLFTADSCASLVLTHSASGFVSGQTDSSFDRLSAGQASVRWFRDHRKAALHATVGIGTVDQALIAVLPAKFSMLRLSGLQGKVLVIDEVHAYDTYMCELLKRLLTFHAALGGSALLLSATLPAQTRDAFVRAFNDGTGNKTEIIDSRLEPFPLLTVVGGQGPLITYRPECSYARKRFTRVSWVDNEEDAIACVLREAASGKCVCWIRNTVRDAVRVYSILSLARPGTTHLFHARVCLGHRIEKEKQILSMFGPKSTQTERRGQILIATQVVEQSLDLDFDFLVSDIAPVDLLIQRAGRLHRHGHREDRPAPEMLVLAPAWTDAPTTAWPGSDFKGTTAVYKDASRLWLTQNILRAQGGIRIPEEARLLVESVYAPGVTYPSGLDRKALEAEGVRRGDGALGGFNALNFETGYADTRGEWLPDNRTPTRLGEESETWLLVDEATGSPILPGLEQSSQIGLRAGSLQRPPVQEDGPSWVHSLRLRREGEVWRCSARSPAGEDVEVTYSPDLGFWIEK